jgi:hypothetical protein
MTVAPWMSASVRPSSGTRTRPSPALMYAPYTLPLTEPVLRSSACMSALPAIALRRFSDFFASAAAAPTSSMTSSAMRSASSAASTSSFLPS